MQTARAEMRAGIICNNAKEKKKLDNITGRMA